MIGAVPRILVLTLVSLMSLGCGNGKGASADGSPPNGGSACLGDPIGCVQGAPWGTGVGCGGLGIVGICVGGQWTCPKGMVDVRDCTCGEPGLSCANQVCTADGPICLDASVDADADTDAATDSRSEGGATDASCDVGCTASAAGSSCQVTEIQWMCQGAGWADALFRASCRDPGTNIQRFCCPPSFLAQCR